MPGKSYIISQLKLSKSFLILVKIVAQSYDVNKSYKKHSGLSFGLSGLAFVSR